MHAQIFFLNNLVVTWRRRGGGDLISKGIPNFNQCIFSVGVQGYAYLQTFVNQMRGIKKLISFEAKTTMPLRLDQLQRYSGYLRKFLSFMYIVLATEMLIFKLTMSLDCF